LPKDFLTIKEVELLVNFFSDRLKDHHSVTPHVLFGLLAMSTFTHLPPGSGQQMVKEVSKEVHVQSLAQADRRSAYSILINLLHTKMEELKPMGADFVYNFIQTMDGERDPRNLVLAFNIVPVIVQNFPIGMFAEELFEVTSCYFPIDFTPPPNDPHGVTKDELVLGLQRCMAATPLFAQYCLPLLIEKMTSDVQSAKKDAFHTLAKCTETYAAKDFQEFLSSLFMCMKREVLSGVSEMVEGAALSALTAVVSVLSTGVQQKNSETLLDGFLKDIIKDCRHHLTQPELKLMYPSGKLLQAAAAGSDQACCIILREIIPLLLEQFHKHTQVLNRRSVLDVLLGFIKISKRFNGSDEKNPVAEYKDAIMPVLFSLLSETNFLLRCAGLTGIVGMLTLTGVTSEEEQCLAAEHMLKLVLEDTDSSVRTEATTALTFISSELTWIVCKIVLPKLVEYLKIDFMETDQSSPHFSSGYLLNTLAAISVHKDIIQETVPILYQQLEDLTNRPATDYSEAELCLNCIANIVQSSVQEKENLDFFYEDLLQKLLKISLQSFINYLSRTEHVLWKQDILLKLCSVIRTICQHLSQRQGEEMVKNVLAVYVEGQSHLWLGGAEAEGAFKPLQASSPWQQTQALHVFLAVICALHQNVLVPSLYSLLDMLVNLTLQLSHSLSQLGTVKCLAGLINKAPQGTELDSYLESLKQKLETLLNTRVESGQHQGAALVWQWVTKALVLRGHPISGKFVEKMMTFFENSNLNKLAADGFYIVMAEFDDVMTKHMHAIIRPLYKQRFFHLTLPGLIQGFNSTIADRKQFYLTALSYLLRFVPKQVLLSELPPLVPLLVQSLLIEEVSLQLSTMTTMYDLMHDAPLILGEYLDTLIPKFLKLSRYEPSMKVRIAALQCLGMMTTLPQHLTTPHQKTVVRELAHPLDDKKRLVRKEAAQARGEWYLLETMQK
ncbi:MMS19 nucleotide excision repair protein homolog, partial [Lingula anatina]|uniref:MMS19 nucleotide excision repair protein n=1 Tax=Lingula anatina TaxID=7574 RepID=A0A1S3J9C2_LINAN